MKFEIILATILVVSAAYTCRSYYRRNGRNMFDDYCDQNTTCVTVSGATISHQNEHVDLDVKGCFTCEHTYGNEGSSTGFKDLTIHDCYECERDYCNDHDD